MRGGKVSGERFRHGHDDDGITSITIREAQSSSDRCRPPGLLWVPPVDPGQEITELRRRDRHHTLSWARPDEATPLQAFCEQAGALAVVSRPRELHPEPLSEPYVTLSRHTALNK